MREGGKGSGTLQFGLQAWIILVHEFLHRAWPIRKAIEDLHLALLPVAENGAGKTARIGYTAAMAGR